MAFNLFPYSNFHKLNLDWVIKTVKEAAATLEEATGTLSQYDQRLRALETSVGVLNQSVQGLSSTIQEQGQAIADLPQIRTQASNAIILAGNAEQAAQAADETASTALTQAQAARQAAEAIAADKLDVESPTASGWLNVSQGNNGGLRLSTFVDNDNNSLVRLVNNNGHLDMSAQRTSNGSSSSFRPRIRNVSAPLDAHDVANKEYVDGTTVTVQGSTVEIEPYNNEIYQCGELAQLTITAPPADGAYSIVFTSGATPTTTIIPATILGLETFVAAANTIYEINVLDNRAVVGSWEVASA